MACTLMRHETNRTSMSFFCNILLKYDTLILKYPVHRQGGDLHHVSSGSLKSLRQFMETGTTSVCRKNLWRKTLSGEYRDQYWQKNQILLTPLLPPAPYFGIACGIREHFLIIHFKLLRAADEFDT